MRREKTADLKARVERSMRERKAKEFKPDWKLTPTEALAITLNLSLNKHIPKWPGCEDEHLLAVARDVIEHVKNEKLDR